jgi:hypothetical protein
VIPHFSRLLSHVPSATYMLVRSGTSRLIIIDGRHLRPGASGREEVRRIMLGADGHRGLGGPTLQDNKVALVWAEPEPAHFRFRFLQVIPSSGAVLPMECSNSASAAAMLAQLGGHHRGRESRWCAVNLSTGQRIELRPNRDHDLADAWAVRFVTSPRARRALAGLTGDHRVRSRGRTICFRPVLVGNLFLFADVDPADVDAAAIDAIARVGMQVARRAGFRPGRGYHPKVVPYRVVSTGARPAVRTASYYHGERHRSFPGSAAMALCAFLAGTHGDDAPALGQWRVRHPSGVMEVELGFDTDHRRPRLAWTEFTTPVSLLAWGAAALPWREEH